MDDKEMFLIHIIQYQNRFLRCEIKCTSLLSMILGIPLPISILIVMNCSFLTILFSNTIFFIACLPVFDQIYKLRQQQLSNFLCELELWYHHSLLSVLDFPELANSKKEQDLVMIKKISSTNLKIKIFYEKEHKRAAKWNEKRVFYQIFFGFDRQHFKEERDKIMEDI